MAWAPDRRGALAALLVAALLAACASLPEGGSAGAGANRVETLAGRLSVVVGANGAVPSRSVSAAFELQGGPAAGRLDLSTPLGSMLARASWSPAQVTLATPRGQAEFSDLDALTREALGESLPVAALFDWLHGRPWAGAPSALATEPGAGFDQLGWSVDLRRFDEALVLARRDSPPPVSVRIKLDRP